LRPDLGLAAQIRTDMPRAWGAFFAAYGRLTKVQLATIPRILAGKSTIVCSATASGKTEAVVAPAAEHLERAGDEISAIYVVPTRALANDTERRIRGPLEHMGFRCGKKHGDHSSLSRNLPNWLITTPESLDSLLCRNARALETVRVLILDEVHLVDGTYRGDQLSVLRRRLQKAAGGLTIHCLSATVADPNGVRGRYGTPDSELIEVSGQREIEWDIVPDAAALVTRAKVSGWRKILCFCNARAATQEVGRSLTPLWRPYHVLVHHGSLSRAEREEAEACMQSDDPAICVATSTLEVGIDIGDIDVVALFDVPHSVQSMLQRVGRGNRRGDVTRAVGVGFDEDERAAMVAMLGAARNGQLPVDGVRRDVSPFIQQVLSMSYGFKDGVEIEYFVEMLSEVCGQRSVGVIIEHLQQEDWLEVVRGKIWPTERLMEEGDHGRVHSNIPDQKTVSVVDSTTGREVGKVSGGMDNRFMLGRQSWEVAAVRDEVIEVVPVAGFADSASFTPTRTRGAYAGLVPASLKGQQG
jgi:ATP-dependent helicase Lhr and Lhr-like helicase